MLAPLPYFLLSPSPQQDVIGLFSAPTTMLSDQFFYAWRGFRAAADALESHLDREKGASDVGLWRWSFLPPTTASERTLLTHTTRHGPHGHTTYSSMTSPSLARRTTHTI